MGVEHDGMIVPIHCNNCVAGLSIWRLFSDQMNHGARQEKFMKPSRVWEKGREDAAIPFTPDQKAVGPVEEVCLDGVFEKPNFFIVVFHVNAY
jgi:hypothetical protein